MSAHAGRRTVPALAWCVATSLPAVDAPLFGSPSVSSAHVRSNLQWREADLSTPPVWRDAPKFQIVSATSRCVIPHPILTQSSPNLDLRGDVTSPAMLLDIPTMMRASRTIAARWTARLGKTIGTASAQTHRAKSNSSVGRGTGRATITRPRRQRRRRRRRRRQRQRRHPAPGEHLIIISVISNRDR
jgi:hypothetical protein